MTWDVLGVPDISGWSPSNLNTARRLSLTQSRKRDQTPHSPIITPSTYPYHLSFLHTLSSIPGTPVVPAISFTEAEKFLPDWNIPEMPSRAEGYVCVSFTCITWLAGGCLLPRGAQPKVIGSTADNPSLLLLVIIHICLRTHTFPSLPHSPHFSLSVLFSSLPFIKLTAPRSRADRSYLTLGVLLAAALALPSILREGWKHRGILLASPSLNTAF